MQAYNKIYESLINAHPDDAEWKKKVDGTIAKYREQGMTNSQAIKHASMDLNTETEVVDKFQGYFLKEYALGERRMVNLTDGVDTIQVEIEKEADLKFPKTPKKVEILNLKKNRLLLADKTTATLSANSKVKIINTPISELVEVAKGIDDFSDGEWGLIRAEAIGFVAWDPDNIVTPEKVNLKLNFESNRTRSGYFLRELGEIRSILPSKEDIEAFDTLCKKGDWDKMFNFVNDVVAQDRDYGVPGADLLIYGQVSERTYTGRDGEERTGKNLRLGAGGFCWNLELLIREDPGPIEKFNKDEEEEPKPAPKTPKPKVTVVEEDEDDSDAQPIGNEDDDDVIGIPDGDETKEVVMRLIKEGPKSGMSATDLSEKAGIATNEIAIAVNTLMAENRVGIKAGKFVDKKD